MRHLKHLFNLSIDLLCVANVDGYFERVSPACERMLGYSEAELKARPITSFVHPEDVDATLAELEKVGHGALTLNFENRYRCKDGAYKWLSWTAAPSAGEGLVYAVARDVTEAKTNLEHLLSDLPGMVYRCNFNDARTMLFVSEGCRELTGYDPDALGEDGNIAYGELIDADDRAKVSKEIKRALGKRREFEIEYRIRDANGAEKIALERGRGLFGDNDEVIALQGFITNITERRQLKSELLQMQKMESLGQLTGGIAHDFNNLLTVVLGNLQLLETEVAAEPDARELLQDALDSAWRGAELSQRLLAFSRRQLLSPEIIGINSLIRDMESLVRRALGGAIDVRICLSDIKDRVLVDAGQLENAVLNLAINARDAMPDGGRLTIETSTFDADTDYADRHPDVVAGSYVVIDVSDTGQGMPPEVLEHAFEPFFTTKETGKGTGLGLSMVYGLLKQSGGHIRIYSEAGHGTSVRLLLPLARPDATGTDTGFHRALDVPEQGSERILIVEDDPRVRKTVVAMLTDLGYGTLEAGTGPEALAQLQERRDEVDLLFSDLVMPGGMNGSELVTEALRRYPDLKVLLTSGFSAEHVMQGPEYPLLRKPYHKRQLAQALRDTLTG